MQERNIDWLPLLYTLTRDQTRHIGMYVSWLGIEPMTFQFIGWCSNQLSHTGQSILLGSLEKKKNKYSKCTKPTAFIHRISHIKYFWRMILIKLIIITSKSLAWLLNLSLVTKVKWFLYNCVTTATLRHSYAPYPKNSISTHIHQKNPGIFAWRDMFQNVK